jgi:hypothetical protein
MDGRRIKDRWKTNQRWIEDESKMSEEVYDTMDSIASSGYALQMSP